MIRKNLLLTLTGLSISTLSFSQAPKYSNEFLSIGVGARALGMSNSYISTCDDVTGGYWNPAALLRIKSDLQVGLMHASYFANIAKYDYGAVAKVIDSNSVAGFSIIRFGVDNIPNTTELIDASGNVDYDRITTFSAADYAFLFSYARKLKIPGLAVGGNFKIIHRKVGDFGKSWGFGVDASATYQYKGWRFAAIARDVTTTFNAWSYTLSESMIDVFTQTGNEIPQNSIEVTLPKLILGSSYGFSFLKKFTLFCELDLDMTFDGKRNVLLGSDPVSVDPHFGFEAGYAKIVFLRGGIGNFQYIKDFDGSKRLNTQPNFGIGVRIKNFYLDYALTDVGNVSDALYSNIFSLRFDINKNPQNRKSL
ncbi:MAG: PorV/PorQ family protein [Flavobacteriales bacterium]